MSQLFNRFDEDYMEVYEKGDVYYNKEKATHNVYHREEIVVKGDTYICHLENGKVMVVDRVYVDYVDKIEDIGLVLKKMYGDVEKFGFILINSFQYRV